MDFYEYLYHMGKLKKEELNQLKSNKEKPGHQLIHQYKLSHKQLANILSQYLKETSMH